ncbi:MAG: diguanylate cyclase [Deltaproteobacteria bacterium]|nr:diguanylate cyclase [Deltaproteobacteria bacterium]
MSERFGQGLRVLVVDDDASVRVVLQELLADAGFVIDTADGLQAGKAGFVAGRFDLVICDKNLGDGSGLDLVRQVLAEAPDCEVIIMSAFASLESAVEAIRMRVGDYLVKPFDSIDVVADRIRRVVEHLNLKRENRALVAELSEKNARLQELVVKDGLTGLFNHAYLQERLESEIKRSDRHGHDVGLVFIDVDRFKEINDTFGHQVGDRVLRGIADLFRGNCRSSDEGFRLREHDIAARYGGDEFVLLLPETAKAGAAIKAERLRSCMEGTRFDGVETSITLSIGVGGFPEDGADRAAVVRAADAALYAAKRMGRNRVMSYEPSLASADAPAGLPVGDAEKRVLALEETLVSRAVRLLYQPVVDAKRWQVVGYEALCSPTHGAFANVRELFAVAERGGRVTDLGRMIRPLALAPLADLGRDAKLFLNLHVAELHDPLLFQDGASLGAGTAKLVLEVTEQTLLAEDTRIYATLRRLRDHGFEVALDNLTSGYAGLEALARLEVDYVKIGPALFSNLPAGGRGARLLKHIMEYAAGEGQRVVAVGVETETQVELLLKLGCPLLQGFFFGHPEPPFARADLAVEVRDKLRRLGLRG